MTICPRYTSQTCLSAQLYFLNYQFKGCYSGWRYVRVLLFQKLDFPKSQFPEKITNSPKSTVCTTLNDNLNRKVDFPNISNAPKLTVCTTLKIKNTVDFDP